MKLIHNVCVRVTSTSNIIQAKGNCRFAAYMKHLASIVFELQQSKQEINTERDSLAELT